MAQENGNKMQILPDGSIQIKNKRTGETKVVQSNELPNYGVSYSKYATELEAFKKVGGKTEAEITQAPSTEGEKTKYNLARTGLQAAKKVRDIYDKDPSILTKQLLPGKFASRSFDSALFATVDTLLRIRTGATAPEEEIRRYINAYGPKFGDSTEDVDFKTNNLVTALIEEGGIPEEESNKLFPGRIKSEVSPTPEKKPTEIPGWLAGLPSGLANLLVPRTKKLITEQLPEYYSQIPQDYGGQLQKMLEGAKMAMPAAGELGAWALPIGKLGLLRGGAVAGGLMGATTPEEVTPEERLRKTGYGALGGALTGGVLKGAGAIVGKVAGAGKKLVTQLFRPLASETDKLRRFQGLDFAEEVIKRDLPEIKGKSNDQILTYYNDKVNQFENAADNFLIPIKEKVDKEEILNLVNQTLKSRKGRVLQATSQVKQLVKDLAKLPQKVDLPTLNQVKRDVQTAAKGFYSATGEPSPASDSLADAARKIKELIEIKAPGIKEVNNSVAFYHTAQEAIQRKLDQSMKQEGIGLLDILGGGGAAGAMMAGRPEIGMAIAAPTLARRLLQRPQVKTQIATLGEQLQGAKMPSLLEKLLLIGGGRMGSSF